jgi:hypothetical protein
VALRPPVLKGQGNGLSRTVWRASLRPSPPKTAAQGDLTSRAADIACPPSRVPSTAGTLGPPTTPSVATHPTTKCCHYVPYLGLFKREETQKGPSEHQRAPHHVNEDICAVPPPGEAGPHIWDRPPQRWFWSAPVPLTEDWYPPYLEGVPLSAT